MHAAYQCQRSGACCTAGWHIPAEPPVVHAVIRHFGSAIGGRRIAIDGDADTPTILGTAEDGACIFYDSTHGRSCQVHRALGERQLPSACRHFPRVTLTDPRGMWITLSHFCPTAAALLFTPGPLRIVAAPSRLSLDETAEGLDATDALPPLLRPGMLMDFAGYGAWQHAAIALLDGHGPDVGAALAALDNATRQLQQWSPGQTTLTARVAEVMSDASGVAAADDPADDAHRLALALASVPDGLPLPDYFTASAPHPPGISQVWRDFDGVIRRYLASTLVASWWPYLGLDLRGVVAAVHIHAAVLRMRIAARLHRHPTARQALLEAIRDTDLLLVHLSDSRVLARRIALEP